MSRLKTAMAVSPLDKAIQNHANAAARSLQQALALCHAARTSEEFDVRRTRRDLQAALGAVDHIRNIVVREIEPAPSQSKPKLASIQPIVVMDEEIEDAS